MNPILKVLSAIRDFIFLSTRHWLSTIGVALATFASISFLVILAMELGGVPVGHYRGLISYIILPSIFVFGLVLIPIGLRLLRKREKAGQPTTFPVLNFNDPRVRSIALLVFALTVLNLMIVSVATYKGVEVMERDEFCGATCHNVMQPEAVAHQVTPHANVKCVDCHIGEGAAHFARAKLNGARQGLEFLLGDYSRPVPQPTHVPSAICTSCHDPERFLGDQLHIRRTYGDQEKPVEQVTIFRTLIGGLRDGKWHGSHEGRLGHLCELLPAHAGLLPVPRQEPPERQGRCDPAEVQRRLPRRDRRPRGEARGAGRALPVGARPAIPARPGPGDAPAARKGSGEEPAGRFCIREAGRSGSCRGQRRSSVHGRCIPRPNQEGSAMFPTSGAWQWKA